MPRIAAKANTATIRMANNENRDANAYMYAQHANAIHLGIPLASATKNATATKMQPMKETVLSNSESINLHILSAIQSILLCYTGADYFRNFSRNAFCLSFIRSILSYCPALYASWAILING